MNLKKLKVARRMRITNIGPGNKLKGMKVAKGFKSIKKINVAKKFKSSFKKRTSGPTADGTVAPAGGAAGGSGRMGTARPRGSSKWMASVRRKIMRPRFGHHKGKGSSKNIIIIHNNTSIVSNEEDNRASCVDVKDSVTLKEEDVSVTSIDSAAPPPPNEGSSSSKGEETDETDQEERQDTTTMTTTTTTTTDEEDQEKLLDYQEFEETEEYHQQQDTRDILTFKEEKASIHIQSVFRGHLARRAFRALKSLVKLQAVVRGVCVRRQARMALLCMNTLVRLQVRVRARQILTRPSDAIHP